MPWMPIAVLENGDGGDPLVPVLGAGRTSVRTNSRRRKVVSRVPFARTQCPLLPVVIAGTVTASLLLAGCSSKDESPAPAHSVPTASHAASNPTSSPKASTPAPAPASWQDACLLTAASVASALAPYGVVIDHTHDGEVNLDDYPTCSYDGPSDGTGAFTIYQIPYDASTTYGFLTTGLPDTGWRAPDAQSGYTNTCKAAQADGGATCVPTIGQGLVVGNNINEAVLFVSGGHFYDFSVLLFAGGDVPHSVYQTLAQQMADAAQ
jgi:hypothetical protein